MSGKIADAKVGHQVELVTRRLDSLSTLPCVAARFFSQLLQPQFSPPALADIIESDPALTAKILSLIPQQAARFTDENPSVRQALDRLPAQLVRDAILSVKVFGTFEPEHSPDSYRALPRKQLALHALAVACCAKEIAEITSPQVDSQMAYSAGLLHDMGKLALDQAMPKSFARIVKEAKSQNSGACAIEQKHLGLDHTILGKRLAQKWHLSNQITLAIWLHHSDTAVISEDMPEARIAQIVQLADLTARQCSIGQSGSYDLPDSSGALAQSLKINSEQLQQIRKNLTERVGQKSEILGLDLPNVAAAYCDIIHTATAQLAQDNTKLSLENSRLQSTSSHFDFTTEFLLSIDSTTPPVDIAENFATRWQKFYQTGIVCLYLVPSAGLPPLLSCNSKTWGLEAVVVEKLSKTKVVYLNAPSETPAIPKAVAKDFAILNADDCVDWLFEQLDVDFDLSQTKIMPLLSNGKAIGVIVFELRYPGDLELFREKFEAATSIAGSVLGMAFACQKQEGFAEQFAQFLTKLKQTQPPRLLVQTSVGALAGSLNALAEMAAGAAHELNNPLSVISGRAQLLAKTETDAEKKRILKQIQENTGEISQIVEDMMSFARPQQPRAARTDIKQMLDEASHLAAKKADVEQVNVEIDVAETIENVFVDSAQIVSAIANIFSNSLESYTGQAGPIKVNAAPLLSAKAEKGVKLTISDSGCGMDAETLQRATQPFFSARPAGRKRGMGLAHAQRIIELNKGSLNITSQPGSGTSVTILLPCE